MNENDAVMVVGDDGWYRRASMRELLEAGVPIPYYPVHEPLGPTNVTGDLYPRRSRAKKKVTVCALPGCEVRTTRGYCCVAHCREHRRDLRFRRGEPAREWGR